MSTEYDEKTKATESAAETQQGELINASGHRQELERNFSLLSICAVAVTTGNTWIAQGGSVVTALSNGGLAGTIYEFIAVSICYWLVAASIAELASGMPSASGVYHWASITAGRYGRVCGFFAGWWNCLAWILGAASMSLIMAQQTVSMYAVMHPDFTPQTWNVFVSFIICTWVCCCIVLFMNRFLPFIGNIGMFFILSGVFITIIVCAVMPSVNGVGYGSNYDVWEKWTNATNYKQQGFVFVMGMLNGAYSVGTPDCSSHLAEEIPKPSRNIPKAVLAQMAVGFITGIAYMVAIFYSIQDLDAVTNSAYNFPLAEIYHQATGTRGGALGLLILAFLPTLVTASGCYITAGRTLWTISRDRATPFPKWLGHINTTFHNPFNATLVCGVLVTILACIYLGSTTAFSAFVGCFVQLSSLSYFMAIFPHILTRRSSFVPGCFFMNNTIGYIVNSLSCVYIIAFVIIFCFPYALPAEAASMNYASLMTGGLTIFVTIWWFVRQGSYEGPKNIPLNDKDLAEDAQKPFSEKEATESNDHPAKKPRLLKDEIGPEDQTRPTPLPGSRKPLLQVRNIGKDSAAKAAGGVVSKEEASFERFFNVLWRKPTTKKNKTWDGDGILAYRSGFVHLRDVGGKEMGRTMHESELEPGKMLYVAGKEVEIDSEIPRKEYFAGKQILSNKKPTPTPSSLPKKGPLPVLNKTNARALSLPTGLERTKSLKRDASSLEDSYSTKSATPLGAYKAPLLNNTVIASVDPESIVPRHDPKAPGALVMPRPASVPQGKYVVDVVVDPVLSKSLRQHQREGVQFLYECVMGMRPFNGEGAILADDMGLGKTLQTIALLWTLLKQNPIHGEPPVIKKALIVCPVTLINNWRKEFRKWLGNERIGVFVFDDKRKRLTDFTRGRAYNIMIVGYEKLRTVQEGLAKGAGVDIIIADEGHRLKTLQNKSGQAIQSLNASKRVILSGTPIQNDLREFFAAVDLVNPGVLGSYKAFIREFETPIVRSRQPEATQKDIEKGESRNEELRELTSKFILRRTADILAKYLPPKSEYVLFCNPTKTQASIYQAVLASPIFQTALGNAESALQLITILKKLCNSPSLLSAKNNDKSPNETIAALLSSLPPNLLRHFSPSSSAKVRVLDQILDSMRTNTSEKIVLVSNYTSTLNLLATLLTSLGLPFLRLDGSTPAQKRQPLVDDFNRLPAESCFAFLLSAKAGGTGLNLIGASRLILFDVDWNPATDIQAMARIHRDGQKHHCRIYRVILKGSLEEKIWQRQVTKIGLADSVMEHKDSVAQFSTAELRDLFRLDEESKCQTHELLGCECGGRGFSSASSSGTTTPKGHKGGDSESELSELSDIPSDDDEDEEFPDLPTLMKASEVDMEKQERAIRDRSRRGRPNYKNDKARAKKQKDNMHQSLAQYCHIDPSLLVHNADQDDEMAAAVDDDVLMTLMKDECNRIGYIFKKTSRAEIEENQATVLES
ncbi:DsDNA-dependent ATPase (Rad54b) [Penicillium macrosclerotiorum]|uniref:DsDNA-dependent ATPase (Rad54b) n=1 Tax=Penicillium macrosclerotiorum TaxID=303699 RepID=UPI00254743B5|nr:DsDNA-dependent ATPase (Rad54b) [Penicillium macrosclerotiorum]KAJ5682864.1 DsDNA-dependent ATPase (Rad54b) [Penicillium macrosclerotiorum]